MKRSSTAPTGSGSTENRKRTFAGVEAASKSPDRIPRSMRHFVSLVTFIFSFNARSRSLFLHVENEIWKLTTRPESDSLLSAALSLLRLSSPPPHHYSGKHTHAARYLSHSHMPMRRHVLKRHSCIEQARAPRAPSVVHVCACVFAFSVISKNFCIFDGDSDGSTALLTRNARLSKIVARTYIGV